MPGNDLSKLSKNQAIDMAGRMRNRAVAIKKNAEKLTERLVHGLLGTAAGFGMGYWMGTAEHEYQENVAKLMAEGKSREDAEKEADDPRQWAGMDKDLLVSLGLAGIAFFNVGGRKISPAIEAAAMGGLAGWAYNYGMETAIDRAEDTEDEEE